MGNGERGMEWGMVLTHAKYAKFFIAASSYYTFANLANLA